MHFIGNEWDQILEDVFSTNEYIELEKFLIDEYTSKVIYPKKENIFNSLKLTPYSKCRVVIIGQDPYHEPNQAHGLAFSVLDGIKLPPSLKNIYKEIETDLGIKMSGSGNLSKWASQGVLLLNNVLTVREHEANSHKKRGWEFVTDSIVKKLNEKEEPIIFIFWGNNAKSKEALVTNPNHIVLKAPHPSPLSAYHGFFGCKHFSKINEILIGLGLQSIDWQI